MIIVMNSDILGKNLKYLHKRMGLSLIEMATLIHMEVNKLEQLEMGLNYEINHFSMLKVQRKLLKT